MSDIAIRCENLSKQYRIGRKERYKTLRDTLTDAMYGPFRRLRSVFDGSNVRAENGEDRIWALKDVSFEVNRGEVVGIIGRNGAGKSTLLKVLSRITEPTGGHAEIHGRIGSLLEVGTGFHPELTGRENIFLNGAILGMKRAEIRGKFDEIVAFAEVEKFIDTPVKHYSSGMYLRLAFAVAAHLEPEILLVDEVLAVGDALFQKKCLGKMGDAAKEGRTILFVSHDMTAIQVLCTKAVHLQAGEVVGIGPAVEQIEEYLNTVKRQTGIRSGKPISLGEDLQLRKLEFTPNPVVSGSAVEFQVELRSSKTTRIDELALLIYSSLGRRVAVLDLRRHGQVYRFDDSNDLKIVGSIKSLPLVEGEYHIGLYLSCGNTQGDFYDLTSITVVSGATPSELAPYNAVYRGIVELDFSFGDFP
jgi:lipopolysaccharide transport system ATP-binding protein